MITGKTAVLLCVAAALPFFAGCAKPSATKAAPKPEPVFVRLSTLEAAHPLAASLRDLTDAAERLRRDSTTPVIPGVAFTLPTVSAAPVDRAAANRRNAAARAALQESALVTLRRYAVARRLTEARIRAEKRAELEGIAHANSADEEAAARARIEAETRAAIFARANAERAAAIKRDAAELNLSNDNVVSLALDPKTKLPDREVTLEKQVQILRDNPVNPPPVSDEARLTKLLRDWDAELARIRKANDRDITFNDALIADAISTIRADNLIWVEEQLAKRPNSSDAQAEGTGLRAELLTLLENLRTGATAPLLPVAPSLANSPAAIAPVRASSADSADAVRRLMKERDAIRAVIRRDTVAAVRDAATVRNLTPGLVPMPGLSDRTADFRGFIFGNVRAVSLSKKQ